MRNITLVFLVCILAIQLSYSQTDVVQMSFEKMDEPLVKIESSEEVNFKLQKVNGELVLVEEDQYRMVKGNKMLGHYHMVNSNGDILLTVVSIGDYADAIKLSNGQRLRVKNAVDGYELLSKEKASVVSIKVINSSEGLIARLNFTSDEYDNSLIQKALVLSMDRFQSFDYRYHPARRNLFVPSLNNGCD